jgi:hypothetical protein
MTGAHTGYDALPIADVLTNEFLYFRTDASFATHLLFSHRCDFLTDALLDLKVVVSHRCPTAVMCCCMFLYTIPWFVAANMMCA